MIVIFITIWHVKNTFIYTEFRLSLAIELGKNILSTNYLRYIKFIQQGVRIQAHCHLNFRQKPFFAQRLSALHVVVPEYNSI